MVQLSDLYVTTGRKHSFDYMDLYGDSRGKNTGVGCYALLEGIFPTQGSHPGLPHCRWILYCLSHQGNPRILEWVSVSLLQGLFLSQESSQGLLHYIQILYQLSTSREALRWA